MSAATRPIQKAITIDHFCLRQFTDPKYGGTKIDWPVEDFENKINEHLDSGAKLSDGYAPFCKHLFMPNFASVPGVIIEITNDNEHLIRTGYEARVPTELPVLARWFPMGSVPAPTARFLDIILYSRKQIRKENAATGKDSASDAPWGVVSIKAQDIDCEIPMQPITMLRNALGVAEGGSGVALEREKYDESVAFWRKHALMK